MKTLNELNTDTFFKFLPSDEGGLFFNLVYMGDRHVRAACIWRKWVCSMNDSEHHLI